LRNNLAIFVTDLPPAAVYIISIDYDKTENRSP
jgi:hypothetical protein